SSRRRHTRSKRDWSSDVCSSDLHPYSDFLLHDIGTGDGIAQTQHAQRPARGSEKMQKAPLETLSREGVARVQARPRPGARRTLRSEERRVGKECRSRRATQQEKE